MGTPYQGVLPSQHLPLVKDKGEIRNNHDEIHHYYENLAEIKEVNCLLTIQYTEDGMYKDRHQAYGFQIDIVVYHILLLLILKEVSEIEMELIDSQDHTQHIKKMEYGGKHYRNLEGSQKSYQVIDDIEEHHPGKGTPGPVLFLGIGCAVENN